MLIITLRKGSGLQDYIYSRTHHTTLHYITVHSTLTQVTIHTLIDLLNYCYYYSMMILTQSWPAMSMAK